MDRTVETPIFDTFTHVTLLLLTISSSSFSAFHLLGLQIWTTIPSFHMLVQQAPYQLSHLPSSLQVVFIKDNQLILNLSGDRFNRSTHDEENEPEAIYVHLMVMG